MLYVVVDAEGCPTACYNDQLVPAIPPEAVPISDAAWDILRQGTHRYVAGALAPKVTPDMEIANAWAALREERNRRLQACDWTQLPDAPCAAVELSAWRAYRQALRDLPSTGDPYHPVWPTVPGATT